MRATRGYGLLENFLARKRAKMANRLIPNELRSGRILDIGCGKTPYFLINTKFKEKYGIDQSVEIFNSNENITLKKFDVEKKLPFKNNFFDVVTMLAVIEHMEMEKAKKIVKEIRRVLKLGGRFILTTPAPWTKSLLGVMARLRMVSPKEIEEHKNAYHQVSIASSFLDKAKFDREKMDFGYFEMGLNNWGYAEK